MDNEKVKNIILCCENRVMDIKYDALMERYKVEAAAYECIRDEIFPELKEADNE